MDECQIKALLAPEYPMGSSMRNHRKMTACDRYCVNFNFSAIRSTFPDAETGS